LAQKAADLIDIANSNGGRDNISVVLVQASETIGRRGLLSRFLGK
jgi:protein phosphatase